MTDERTDALVITTERLELRPYTRDEATAVAAGDRTGRAWSEGFPREDDRGVARRVLGVPEDADPRFGTYQIVLRSTGLVIGALGFFGPPDEEGAVEFGYGIAPEHEGQGYTTEAVLGMLEMAFADPGVRLAKADTVLDNVASQRVLAKAGLRHVSSDDQKHYFRREAPGRRTERPG